MSKSFKLNIQLENIVKDIIHERNHYELEEKLNDRIFSLLDNIYESRVTFKKKEISSIIKNNFKKELLKEVMSEMSEDEDYLTSTINKKINTVTENYLKEWIDKKITT
jgi:CHASE3 domain sensor protein